MSAILLLGACLILGVAMARNPRLPDGILPKDVWGFDPQTGKPKDWPLPYSMVTFSILLKDLAPGPYEFRARTVDLNDFAQPEPRPYQKSGMNLVPCQALVVTA